MPVYCVCWAHLYHMLVVCARAFIKYRMVMDS